MSFSLADVKSYLESNGLDQEAEKSLNKDAAAANIRASLYRSNAESYKMSTEAVKVKTGISRRKNDQRDELMRALIQENHAGAVGAMKEAEELRQLTQLESLLREESLAMERQRQELTLQIKESKNEHMKKFSMEAEKDLIRLETNRKKFEDEYETKRAEIDTIRNELAVAESQITKKDANTASKTVASNPEGSKGDQSDKLRVLAKEHAANLARARQVAIRAQQQMGDLSKGKFSLDTQQKNVPAGGGYGDGDGTGDASASMENANLAPMKPALSDEQLRDILSGETFDKQQNRVKYLKSMAAAEDDALSKDEALRGANSKGTGQGQGTVPLEGGLGDALERWLRDEADLAHSTTPTPSSTSAPAPAPSTGPKSMRPTGIKSTQGSSGSFPTLGPHPGSRPVSRPNSGNNNYNNKRPPRDRSGLGVQTSSSSSSIPPELLANADPALVSFMQNMQNEMTSLRKNSEYSGGGSARERESIESMGRMRQPHTKQQQQQDGQQYGQQMGYPQQHQQYGQPYAPLPYPPNSNQGMGMWQGYQYEQGNQGAYLSGDSAKERLLKQAADDLERENAMLRPQRQDQWQGQGQGQAGHNSLSNRRLRGQDNAARQMELKHEEEMKKMSFEIERINKERDLNRLRMEVEEETKASEKAAKRASWLEDQKTELAELKLKQVLAKERKLLELQEGTQSESGKSDEQGPSEPSKAKAVPPEWGVSGAGIISLPCSVVEGVALIGDGVLLTQPRAEGGSFRIVLALYDKNGMSLTRLGASDWCAWTIPSAGHGALETQRSSLSENGAPGTPKTVGGGGASGAATTPWGTPTGTLSVQYMAKPVFRGYELKVSVDNLASMGPRAVIELQTRLADGLPFKSAGWCNLAITNGATFNNGMWRIPLKQGASNSTVPVSTVHEDYGAWLLVRVVCKAELSQAKGWLAKDIGPRFAEEVQRIYLPPRDTTINAPSQQQEKLATARPPSALPTPQKPATPAAASPPIPMPAPEGCAGDAAESGGGIKSMDQVAGLANMLGKLTHKHPPGLVPASPKTPEPMDMDLGGDMDMGDLEPAVDEAQEEPPAGDENVFWRPGSPNGPCTIRYQRGDGIDIYIDGAMGLPDNALASRVICKLRSSKDPVKGEDDLPFEREGVSAANTPCSAPVYGSLQCTCIRTEGRSEGGEKPVFQHYYYGATSC